MTFSFDRPSRHAEYQRMFGVGVQYNCDESVSFPASLLDEANPRADGESRRILQRHVDVFAQSLPRNEYDLVRAYLIGHLSDPSSLSIEAAAHYLGLHPRALLRRIKQRGTTFRDLVLEIRLTLAASHLQHSRAPVAQISQLVGYTEFSSFSRAFAKRYGCPQLRWRNRAESLRSDA